VLVTTVTFAAAWIVNTVVATNPVIRANAPAGPRALALVQDAPNFANAPAVTFADRWPRTTASMQASVMPLLPPHPLEIAANVPVPPQPERATSVPLPRPHAAPHDIALAPVGQIGPQTAPQVAMATPPPPAEKRAAPQEAHNKPLALPAPDSRMAVYDIAAHTVYLPNGQRLEAHSGLGDKLDDPRYVHVRMRGPTPPNVYDLALREEPFHGVRAIRLNPVDDGKMFGRDGMLPRWFAHAHPRWRSPHVAILIYAAIAFLFSITSTFAALAIMANVAALLLYVICCAAAWELMRRDVRAESDPFTFVGSSFVPPLAILAIIWILAHATMREFVVNGAVFVVGSALYLVQLALRRRTLSKG